LNGTAVHFGAGNIGRGFLGQLYFESGLKTVFVDVVDEVVAALQQRRSYPVRIVEEQAETLIIQNADAVHGRNLEAVAACLAEAVIASTAVGVNALPHICPALAKGIEARFSNPDALPLDIIVCENMLNAGPWLREKVREKLDPAFHTVLDEMVGFVEASIGRMVPVMTGAQKAEDPLLVCVEPYCELPVDANGFKGPVPDIRHMKAIPNFGAYVERKLFVHNLSHAATAYLGWLRGHDYIWQAIRDDAVRHEVEAATCESCRALTAKHGLDAAELEEHRRDLIRRYHNRALGDQVARVARDPIRKLGPEDRIIGAAHMCREQQVEPEHTAFIAAAALHYDNPDDPGARRIQERMKQEGSAHVLRGICGVEPDSALADLITAGTERLRDEGWIR
jgi:mannitol-1-phosphate 5-dehydrogenase